MWMRKECITEKRGNHFTTSHRIKINDRFCETANQRGMKLIYLALKFFRLELKKKWIVTISTVFQHRINAFRNRYGSQNFGKIVDEMLYFYHNAMSLTAHFMQSYSAIFLKTVVMFLRTWWKVPKTNRFNESDITIHSYEIKRMCAFYMYNGLYEKYLALSRKTFLRVNSFHFST